MTELLVTLDVTESLAKGLASKVKELVADATLAIEADAKVRIQTGKKSGRKYKRGKKVHTASAPGESPATDAGKLVGSINSRIRGMEGEVSADAVYAAPLEFGTVDGRIAPRPFMRPAAEAGVEIFREGAARLIE